MSSPAQRMVSAAFFLSGASGLIFEVVWFHRCGLVLGNTIWASSVVLSSFMGGLAIGSVLAARCADRIRDFLRTYAALEIVVAVTGLGLTVALPGFSTLLKPIMRAGLETSWLVNLVRIVTAFCALVVPSTAMGATLPVLTAAVCRLQPGFGRALGRLYGWNAIGAVAGVIGAETVLVPRFGVVGSAMIAALLNLVAATVALAVWKLTTTGSNHVARTPSPQGVRSRTAWRTLACAALAGAGLMALEVIWFRMLSMFVVNTTLAMSLMLAAVLTAIGLGGLAGSWWIGRNAAAEQFVAAIGFAIACVVMVSYESFRFANGDLRPSEWYRIMSFALWLTFPASVLSGVIFTLLGQVLRPLASSDLTTASGLMVANTVGATTGPILTAFVLLPWFGMERSLVGLAVVYCLIGLLMLGTAKRGRRRTAVRATWVTGIAALVCFWFFPFGLMSERYFAEATRAHTSDGSQVVASKEGAEETIFLTRKSWGEEPIYYRLVTNGFSMAATAVPGKRYMRQFVYLPMLLRGAELRRALVICYGVGVTATAVTDLPSVQSIDVVEISRDVVGMSDFIYPPGQRPLNDPRVTLHLEDGRFFLQNTLAQYDLITGEPPPPLTPGTVNIYTREYFQLIRDHLAEGGIATYWLPVGRQEGVDHASIVRSFCVVFDDCSLWNGTPNDLMLMGTNRARGPAPATQISSAWNAPVLGAHLREAGFEEPEQFGATFLGDASYLKGLSARSSALVDNYPKRLWLSAPTSAEPISVFDRGGSQLLNEVLDPSRARSAFESSSFIRQMWPDEWRAQVLPFFEVQRVVNRVLGEGANVLGQIEDLHFLLTHTSLRTLPFWLLGLGNHPILARVDTMPNDGTGQVEYVRGLRALVARNFTVAAANFAQSNARGLSGSRQMLAYALCLTGDLDTAKQVARGSELATRDQQHFWEWLRSTFGVGP